MCGEKWGTMLLTGKYFRSLDDKGRTALPKPIRDEMGHPATSIAYLAPGSDGSLALYTQEAFAAMADQLAQRSPTQQDVRDFGRLFYAQAQRVDIDRQGRIRIPQDLSEWAGLEKEVVLLGVRDHLEIWNAARWESYLMEKQQLYDHIAENAFNSGGSPLANLSPNAPNQPR